MSEATLTIPLTGILEAAVYCSDLDAAREFYGATLGLEEVVAVEERHVFFRCGNTMVLVFNPEQTVKPPNNSAMPVPPHGATGEGHICFTVPTAKMEEAADALRRKGIEIEADFNWPNGARSVYFRDPGGNSVEFSEARLWGFDEGLGNA